jgi:N-acetylmuramate 1-kinase
MTRLFERSYEFHTPSETENLAKTLSLWARAGHVIALSGELGAGKSTFARAFIKALAKPGDDFDIPSPSFSLMQLYDNTRLPVAHVDLYRLSTSVETEELGLFELLATCVMLIEWPDRLAKPLSTNTLELNFSGTGEARTVKLRAQGDWNDLLDRNDAIAAFLASTKWQGATRAFLEGDASSRRYETLTKNQRRTILMDMPQRADGPPVKDGKPYSAIAHLAEGIGSVFSVNNHLVSLGYSAPVIEACDLNHGLAIIEDLGELVYGRMMHAGTNMAEPMTTAVAVLADMATKDWPTTIATYDTQAQLIEADLLVSWFWPYVHGTAPDPKLHATFENIWCRILPLAQPEKPYWVLRDFHSPNLIWIPDRDGLKRVGLIDTQDAVLGHPAYDLASFLQDARVDVDFSWADELYVKYENLRHQQGDFDADKFAAAYAVLGAQRATKILGIFARLARRDGKPAYLKHMPRVSRYLARNLQHPALATLKHWYEMNMPEALAVGQS